MSNIIEVEYIKNDLSPSWFIEGSIDFESKVYTLMALKKVENNIQIDLNKEKLCEKY